MLVRLVVAVLAGVGVGISFEPYRLVLLLPVAVAAFTLACRGTTAPRGLLVGLTFGFAFMLTLLPWLQVIGVDGWIALSVLEAVFYGLLGVGTVVVTRMPLWPVWAAALWVGAEALRANIPFGGFPWGRLSFATVDTPVEGLYPYLGSAGVTFVVALVSTTLAWTVVHARPAPLRAAGGLAASIALVSAGAVLPAADLSADTSAGGDRPTVTVAAVQGNVPGEGMNAFAERRAVLDNHVEATKQFAAAVKRGERPQPDLVIWPENSTDIDPFGDPSVMADISDAVAAVGVPTLVGALTWGADGNVRNVGIVWDPVTGPGETYAKRHLVPFGEYIPFRDLLSPYIGRLEQVGADKVPGDEPGVLQMGSTTVGDVICFEVAYDELFRDVIDGGAELLVVQTNNATYISTGQVEQQFAISRLRAIETGRYVVIAATNGISGIVAPDGEVLARTEARTREVLAEEVVLLDQVTPAMRWGAPIELALSGTGLLAVLVGLGAAYRARRRGRAGHTVGRRG